jgi:hypothetical protein
MDKQDFLEEVGHIASEMPFNVLILFLASPVLVLIGSYVLIKRLIR